MAIAVPEPLADPAFGVLARGDVAFELRGFEGVEDLAELRTGLETHGLEVVAAEEAGGLHGVFELGAAGLAEEDVAKVTVGGERVRCSNRSYACKRRSRSAAL
jgi:hypothetical protein